MTAAKDPTCDTVNRLIKSCQHAYDGFRFAANSADDANLRRLFEIYARQRSRFAEELRSNVPGLVLANECEAAETSDWMGLASSETDSDLLARCLEADERALQAYRNALAARLPTKAHFLISAQFSLMERVHERISGLLATSARPRQGIAAFAC